MVRPLRSRAFSACQHGCATQCPGLWLPLPHLVGHPTHLCFGERSGHTAGPDRGCQNVFASRVADPGVEWFDMVVTIPSELVLGCVDQKLLQLNRLLKFPETPPT